MSKSKCLSFQRHITNRIRGRPAICGSHHETLRAAHTGGTILVHGNGPSCRAGYDFAHNTFRDELIVIGMNASPMIVMPHYYVIVDSRATLRYVPRFDLSNTTAILADTALTRVRNRFRKEHPQDYQKITTLCRSSRTIHLQRLRSYYLINTSLDWIAGGNAGTTALQLALLMLEPAQHTERESKSPGRLLVTGLDGYDPHSRHHIDTQSEDAQDVFGMNYCQTALMGQVFQFASDRGIELWNLNEPSKLLINAHGRSKVFDGRGGNDT